MSNHSRRSFLKLTSIATVSSVPLFARASVNAVETSAEKLGAKAFPFTLGMTSYTFRSFTLDQVIAMTQRLSLKTLGLKDMHLPLTSSDQEIHSTVEKIRQAGIDLDSCGVVYMKSEEEVAQAFSYAKKAGMKMIVGGPNPDMLPAVERFAKETDIRLAIHNHGPTDKNYPAPGDVYKAIKNMDKRIGLCIDIGHTQRIGLDPTVEFTKYFDRVFDVHIKDTTASDKSGTTVEIGRGVIDVPKFLRAALRLKYAGAFHFEHEKDDKDPLPGAAESVGYVRGVLATI